MRDAVVRICNGSIRLLIVVGVLAGVAQAADGPCTPPPTDQEWNGLFEEHQGARRESEMAVSGQDGDTPLIGFIDSPSATCYQPNPSQNVCYITWYYVSVSASPNYMICMYVKLNDRGIVANTNGFFQTSIYVPYNMLGQGIRVPCGALGSGGYGDLGSSYAYTIRAADSAGLRSANYGTVYCPAYVP